MNWVEFEQKVPKNIPFSPGQINIFFPEANLKSIQQNLFNWQRKQRIVKLRRNFYVIKNKNIDLGLIANKIYEPSYLSLEYGLSFYNLIPEAVFGITSVTTNKTKQFENRLGNFIYRKIKKELYFGFYYFNNILIADREKCFLDYFYFNLSRVKFEENYLKELRLQNMEKLKIKKLREYVKRFKVKKLEQFIDFCLKGSLNN